MEELLYSPLDLAVIISSLKLDCQRQAEVLELIWENEAPFLQAEYRFEKRRLIQKTMYWLAYLSDKPSIDAELPVIVRDAMATGTRLNEEDYAAEIANFDLYFKSVRIRILYGGGNPYVRLKRRTLLKHFGYRRISPSLIERFQQRMYFYHLQSYVRDYVECRIEDAAMDDMIVFRVI